MRRDFPHPSRHTVCEFGTIDDHEDVRLGRHNGIGRLSNAPQNFRQAANDSAKADNRQIAERKWTDDALAGHMCAADAGKSRARHSLLERRNQRCA